MRVPVNGPEGQISELSPGAHPGGFLPASEPPCVLGPQPGMPFLWSLAQLAPFPISVSVQMPGLLPPLRPGARHPAGRAHHLIPCLP